MSNDTMRGLFFIIKGQHAWKKEPSYTNRVSGETGHLGGYDPEDSVEWYQVLDRKCFHSIYCGSDYEKAVSSIRRCIVKHKGVAKNYFKDVSKYTSDDYYEVHYLGRPELTPEKRAKKCEGRCPRTSPIMMDMYAHIDSLWGNYFQSDIEKQEDLAYKEVAGNSLLNRSRKMLKRTPKPVQTPVIEKAEPEEELPFSQHVERKPVLRKPEKKDIPPTANKTGKRLVKLS